MTEMSVTELSVIPPRQRAKRYRELAHDARRKAPLCMGNMKEAFVKFAGKLEKLALEADSEFWKSNLYDPDRRVADFTLLAETAQQMGAKARSETARADYLRIAQGWLQLAASTAALPRGPTSARPGTPFALCSHH